MGRNYQKFVDKRIVIGLTRSYRDARMALSLGRRFNDRDRVYCLDRLEIAAFIGVADEQTKIELATHLLSPLDCELELLATVEAFFAHDCSPSVTAKQLLIHRNSLNYRLDKLASLIDSIRGVLMMRYSFA